MTGRKGVTGEDEGPVGLGAEVQMKVRCALVVLVGLQAAGSGLQEVVRKAPLFGVELRAAGDVDADGVGDFVIGDGGWSESGLKRAWWVVSGKSGAEIAAFLEEDGAANFPERVRAAGERDGDGAADLWLELKEKRVVLWSGKQRAVAREATEEERKLAFAEPTASDLNGDGVPDPLRVESGKSLILNGADETVLWQIERIYERVVPLGRYGTQPKSALLCINSRVGVAEGVVELRTGDTAAELWSISDSSFWYFGSLLEVIGDTNADGVNDFVVTGYHGRSHENGKVQLRSGANGSPLLEFTRANRSILRRPR